jgi:surfactin synthase thioesterase subunit
MRLFCLPYSGGSSMVYARWRRHLPSWIDVRPVEWPGRGARMDEPLETDPHKLSARLAAELSWELHGSYALFGHSLGALVAFELAHCLIDRGMPAPEMLFASATEAPAVRDGSKWRKPLSDEALLAELRALNGTPEEALASAEIMNSALPVLRADFLMCGAYVHRERRPLPCPIHVFGGTNDATDPVALEAWSRETSSGFSLDMFEGDHFFIHARQRELLRRIEAHLRAPPAHAVLYADAAS